MGYYNKLLNKSVGPHEDSYLSDEDIDKLDASSDEKLSKLIAKQKKTRSLLNKKGKARSIISGAIASSILASGLLTPIYSKTDKAKKLGVLALGGSALATGLYRNKSIHRKRDASDEILRYLANKESKNRSKSYSIVIKEANEGKLWDLAEKYNKPVLVMAKHIKRHPEEFDDKWQKRATFALNASKWKHKK